jgi:hypothetical protein
MKYMIMHYASQADIDAANVAHGLGRGSVGAAVGAWPAVALVGVLRVAHDGYPRFSGGAGRRARQGGSAGSAPGAGGGGVRRSAGSGSRSVGSRDTGAVPRRPASCAAAAGLPCSWGKTRGKPRGVNNLKELASR